MRIISGHFKGRKLSSLRKVGKKDQPRPTTDRTRETIFNILSSENFPNLFSGARVLDLFAGTGALGLEALSRGASVVWLIDNGNNSSFLIQKNMQILGYPDDLVFKKWNALKLPICKQRPFNLIFLDPPYSSNLGQPALVRAYRNNWIALNALVVWEGVKKDLDVPTCFECIITKKIGDSYVNIFQLS